MLIYVCHFHHHHCLIVAQLWALSRYSCVYLGSLHPRNFTLKDCSKINDRNGFGCKSSFRKHTTRVHENLRQFMCDKCYKAFGLRKTSEMHEKLYHSITYKSCDESFIQKFNFATHKISQWKSNEHQMCVLWKNFPKHWPQDSEFTLLIINILSKQMWIPQKNREIMKW